MFSDIQVSNIKGLQECKLLDLGKINVICGKNNSGKSTILEGIDKHRTVGKKFEEGDIKEFYDKTVGFLGLGGRLSGLEGTYLYLLQVALPRREAWFPDEDAVFVNGLRQQYDHAALPADTFIPEVIAEVFKLCLSDRDKSILLPPKRFLELSVRVNTGQEINPGGDGILNYLFYARNQIEPSEDLKVYKQIYTAFTTISSGYKFDIQLDKQNELTLRFAYKNLPWHLAQDCGLGLQDLLIILFFALYPEYQVILIEEPESHIHPDMQRKLLSFLREETNKQFFMTTHSNVFLNNTLVDKVFYTHFEDAIMIDDATSRAAILNDLGYSVTDNLVSDLTILVEGPKDTPVIEEFLVKLDLFSQYNIKTWPLGGDIMDQVDLSVFAQNYVIIALVDNDPGSKVIRERFIQNCQQYNIPVHQLERYSIENYFSIRALKEVFKAQISETLTQIDPHTKLEDQIGMNVKNNTRKIVSKMDLVEIENTDLYSFFERVRELCIQHASDLSREN